MKLRYGENQAWLSPYRLKRRFQRGNIVAWRRLTPRQPRLMFSNLTLDLCLTPAAMGIANVVAPFAGTAVCPAAA
jgi:hypothetical protein